MLSWLSYFSLGSILPFLALIPAVLAHLKTKGIKAIQCNEERVCLLAKFTC